MGYSARAIVGLGVEIDVQELTNAIVKHNEQLEETLDEDLYFDVDEHPDYKDPDYSIYEFFNDDKVNAELKIRNLYYDCTSYDYENQIFIFYELKDINDLLALDKTPTIDKNKLENIKKSILEFVELYNLKIIGDFGIQVAADYS
jgi:hypothetical protein